MTISSELCFKFKPIKSVSDSLLFMSGLHDYGLENPKRLQYSSPRNAVYSKYSDYFNLLLLTFTPDQKNSTLKIMAFNLM